MSELENFAWCLNKPMLDIIWKKKRKVPKLVQRENKMKCYICGKEIPEEISKYEETTITITSKWCDDCLERENKKFFLV